MTVKAFLVSPVSKHQTDSEERAIAHFPWATFEIIRVRGPRDPEDSGLTARQAVEKLKEASHKTGPVQVHVIANGGTARQIPVFLHAMQGGIEHAGSVPHENMEFDVYDEWANMTLIDVQRDGVSVIAY